MNDATEWLSGKRIKRHSVLRYIAHYYNKIFYEIIELIIWNVNKPHLPCSQNFILSNRPEIITCKRYCLLFKDIYIIPCWHKNSKMIKEGAKRVLRSMQVC